LTRYAGWQYIFYLNVPIGAVALLLAPRIVPESRLDTARRTFDAAGALAGTGGLVLLVDGISRAPQYGWGATRTIGVLAAAAVLLAVFLLIERRVTDPILPLQIFRLRTLAGANAAGLLLGGSFYAFIFVGTLYMQQVLHYSALQTGVRVAGRVADLDRARRSLPGAGDPRRDQDRDGGRDDDDRRRGDLGHPGVDPRPAQRRGPHLPAESLTKR
jgi:hypothetical protein